jgi:hypothetical protein
LSDKFLTPAEQWTLFLWLLQNPEKAEPGSEPELFATLMNYSAEEVAAAISDAERRGFTGETTII